METYTGYADTVREDEKSGKDVARQSRQKRYKSSDHRGPVEALGQAE